jgi:L-lactate utilization protein LutC
MPKDEFLESVRRALGNSRFAPGGSGPRRGDRPVAPTYPRLSESLAELEAQAREVQQRAADNQAALSDQLATTAKLRGWQVCRTPNPEEAISYIVSVATAVGARQLVRSDQEVFHTIPLDTALKNLGFQLITIVRDETHSRELLREAIASADLSITGVDYAVAETGSVVVLPRQGLSRLVSVVPPVHVALVRPRQVLATLDEVFLLRRLEYYRKGGDMGSYLNFITGPSRTADIEQTLVVGVHGPKEVHLVLLG